MYHCVAAALFCGVALIFHLGVGASAGTDRLASLGRLWGFVKFAHPRVALGHGEWDAPVLTAIPLARAAPDDRGFAAVVDQMLRSLDDPLTRVLEPRPAATRRTQAVGPLVSDLGSVTLLDLRAIATQEQLKSISLPEHAERSVIVDLRGSGPTLPGYGDVFRRLFVSERVQLPALRIATVTPFERYQSLRAAQFVEPEAGTPARRLVFVLDPDARVPSVTYALRQRGSASFLCVGDPPDGGEPVESFPLLGGYVAQVRVAEFTIEGKRAALLCDEQLAADVTDAQVHGAAHRLLEKPAALAAFPPDDPPIQPVEARYESFRYPDEAHRVLGVFRLWAFANYLFAYKHLMDRPWDEVLPEFIPRASSARNELEYARSLAALAARLQDSHVGIRDSPVLQRWYGGEPQAAQVRFIEGKPIVVRVLENVPNGPQVGDEILEVDGQSVADRNNRVLPYISYSTPWARDRVLGNLLTAGPDGTQGKLLVRRDGEVVQVATSVRTAKNRGRAQRDGAVVRVLEGGIGYVDLDRLERGDVSGAFEQLKHTNGMVFDMRGYPRGTGPLIVERINRRGDAISAMFYTPVVMGGWTMTSHHTIQRLAASTAMYTKPTAMLIDERTMSQAEWTGMLLKAANGTAWIGSPTVGANGQVATFPLPGGLTFTFTGSDTRHPDGSQLQRIGLQPDLEVRPTIAGIRAGRDEVLERALRFLTTGN